MRLALEKKEKPVEKGENTGKQHRHLFSRCFQKLTLGLLGLLKLGIVW